MQDEALRDMNSLEILTDKTLRILDSAPEDDPLDIPTDRALKDLWRRALRDVRPGRHRRLFFGIFQTTYFDPIFSLFVFAPRHTSKIRDCDQIDTPQYHHSHTDAENGWIVDGRLSVP